MAVDHRPAPVGNAEEPASGGGESPRWYQRLAELLYVFFCFEIGVLLLVLPWLDPWTQNYFSGLGSGWNQVWRSPYLKGAVSGLGVIDIGIAAVELFRLRRSFRQDR